MKVSFWVQQRVNFVREDVGLEPHFSVWTAVLQTVAAWTCVCLQVYLTYEVLAYTTGDGIEQAKNGSKLELLLEQIAELNAT